MEEKNRDNVTIRKLLSFTPELYKMSFEVAIPPQML